MEGSHWTQLQIWSPSIWMISAGFVAGVMRLPVTFMYTSHLGGFISFSTSLRAARSFSRAGSMSFVWKPPEVFSSLACRQPSVFWAFAMSFSIALCVPAQEKPFGKRKFAIWQTSLGPEMQSLQSFCRVSWSRPATDSMLWGEASAASCIASPRSFTSRRPSSKVMTPAAQSAVYSPRERPAKAEALLTASSRSPLSFSTPARPAMKSAGWQ
mmetsp:Transcript_21183/g.59908  ORF Transcript_21183/g.59908 Transcript_21183/m.59908 type:complete len:212 (+) Transcript_21183:311-946(+)